MKYQYSIIYVDDVEKTLEFYQRAFGFELKFLHEGKDYGELKTGDCILAFANHKLGEMNLQGKYTKSDIKDNPLGFELGFTVENVETAYNKALDEGAVAVSPPTKKTLGTDCSLHQSYRRHSYRFWRPCALIRKFFVAIY